MVKILPTALIIILLLFLGSCRSHVQKDDYNNNLCAKYLRDFDQKYQNFESSNETAKPLDFLALYSICCSKGDSLFYEIKQAREVYKFENGKKVMQLYFELLHFRNADQIDSAVKKIMKNNCVDPFNLKLYRAYRTSSNTVIFVNYYNFDIVSYEDFLRGEFKNLRIDTINSPYDCPLP